jgi:hypothetical protein
MLASLACTRIQYPPSSNQRSDFVEVNTEPSSNSYLVPKDTPEIRITPETPLGVKDYLEKVIREDYQYAHNPHEAGENTFPGGYLEAHGEGQCDEFALNALKNLYTASDLMNLGYIEIWERETKYGIIIVKQRGHAFVAYQNQFQLWKGLSNGQDLGVATDSLEGLIKSVVIQVGYDLSKTYAYYIPLEDLPIETIFAEDNIDYKFEIKEMEAGKEITFK